MGSKFTTFIDFNIIDIFTQLGLKLGRTDEIEYRLINLQAINLLLILNIYLFV